MYTLIVYTHTSEALKQVAANYDELLKTLTAVMLEDKYVQGSIYLGEINDRNPFALDDLMPIYTQSKIN